MTTQRPNLFKYAHKELSQDAVICWLLKWAGKRYAEVSPNLHEAGQNFAKALFCMHKRPGPESIHTVELGQQVYGIDVLAWINDKYALLIEDKKDSGEHDGQLARYHALVLNGELRIDEKPKPVNPTLKNFFPIFLKTGNMSRREKNFIENSENKEGEKLDPPYRVFERGDFLDVLKDCGRGTSEILSDFRHHLEERQERFESWKGKRLTENWSSEDWQGFYHSLEKELDPECKNVRNIGWEYVNPRGGDGFWGFWWYPEGADLYLQAKQDELHFKIDAEHRETRRERRRHWHERIMEAGESAGMTVVKPARFGSGKTMTVAVLEEVDWRQPDREGRLDLEKTVEVLQKAERVLQAAVSTS